MIKHVFIGKPYNKDCKLDIKVSSAGVFSVLLPAEVAKLFAGKIELERKPPRGKDRFTKYDDLPRGYFTADTLSDLMKQVKDKLTELVSEREISRELVIRFSIDTACTYHIDGDDFYPCGDDGRETRTGTTARFPGGHDTGPYGFRIYACPEAKITREYAASGETRVEYKTPSHEELVEDFDGKAGWLNMLSGLQHKQFLSGSPMPELQEVPMTEDTLTFFVNLFKSLFALNERLKDFLTPEGIQQLASGDLKLLGG